nr:MAG TPA: hypothetical protein [Caudoviricetes sp.]
MSLSKKSKKINCVRPCRLKDIVMTRLRKSLNLNPT